jgi:hypothetical protein
MNRRAEKPARWEILLRQKCGNHFGMKIAAFNDGYEKEVNSAREKNGILVKIHKEADLRPLQTDLKGRKCSEKESRWLNGKGILSYG